MLQRSFGLFGALALVLTGCMGPQHAVGIQQVDTLVARIEKVHLDAELGREKIQDAVGNLRVIVRQEFSGDAADAYADFVKAVERSEAQVNRLRSNVEPMQASASQVYDAWTEDLESFTSKTLRERSEQRRDLTTARYKVVVEAITPAIDGLDAYNRMLRDHALFLSYDLNASSVKDLAPELDVMRDHAEVLDDRIDTLLKAASEYVRAAAPLGQVRLTGEATEGR
ncbi:DUF2959 family protein [Engelhardtia mirabilis]|uniref:DUF2959 domain-containing protein n=1 Tax=Engelhardtia mirabilis TaxID=2528011 RepID=A0A518BN68_9BACT|nr:hypothetical protein Pla133_35190 [Planctomycetes bacterium Pla133]QDV02747.1 hypothetical protein Pla86_35170 [Planctomycetes bacterium Pla86]